MDAAHSPKNYHHRPYQHIHNRYVAFFVCFASELHRTQTREALVAPSSVSYKFQGAEQDHQNPQGRSTEAEAIELSPSTNFGDDGTIWARGSLLKARKRSNYATFEAPKETWHPYCQDIQQ